MARRAPPPRSDSRPGGRGANPKPADAVPAESIGLISRSGHLGTALVVFTLVFLTFWPTLRAGFVDWDDTDNFLRNPDYRGLGAPQLRWMFTTFHMGHYQPLAWLTLGFDYVWGRALLPADPVHGPGMNPRSYHLTSNLIHAANAVLFYFLALQILSWTGSPGHGQTRGLSLAAAFAALAFGLHPLRAESVSWITQRRDLLSAFFFLLTLRIYLRLHGTGRARRRAWMLVALGTFVLCNLSKVIGVTLPFLLFILDVYPLRRLRGGPRTWLARDSWPILLEKVPFLAIALVFAVIASRGQAGMGALVPLSMHPVSGRIGVVAHGLLFYLAKTVWPVHLVPIYELHLPVRLTEARFAFSILGVVLLVAAVILARRRFPAVVAAAACYLILFLPTSGIIQNGWQLAHDRYSYLACLSWAVLAAGGLRRIASSARLGRRAWVVVGIGAGLMAALGVTARAQSRIWISTATLWTHAARHAPDSSFAQNGLGYVMLEAGRPEEAVPALRRAIAILPTNEKAHSNLGEALRRLRRDEELYQAYLDAVRLLPNSAEARFNLANALLRRGKVDDAIAQLQVAISINDAKADAHGLLGAALLQKGDVDGAIRENQRAIERDASLVPARLNLARALAARNRTGEAIEQLRAVIRIDPGNAAAQRELQKLGG